jgi:hypothetical protein
MVPPSTEDDDKEVRVKRKMMREIQVLKMHQQRQGNSISKVSLIQET